MRLNSARAAAMVCLALALIDPSKLAREVLIEERRPEEVATARKVPVRTVYKAVREAKRNLRGEPWLREFVER